MPARIGPGNTLFSAPYLQIVGQPEVMHDPLPTLVSLLETVRQLEEASGLVGNCQSHSQGYRGLLAGGVT